jgi:hypothetical protein
VKEYRPCAARRRRLACEIFFGNSRLREFEVRARSRGARPASAFWSPPHPSRLRRATFPSRGRLFAPFRCHICFFFGSPFGNYSQSFNGL